MARKSMLEDLFDLLRKLPWWVGVATAVMFWIIGLIFTGGNTHNAVQDALRPLVKFAFNGLAILALIAAVVFFIQSRSRKKLRGQERHGLSPIPRLT